MEREILRYLGYGGAQADKRTMEIIDECVKLLEKQCKPRYVSKIVNVEVRDSNVTIAGGIKICSESLGRALDGCNQIMVFGATLGVEADTLIRREGSRQISRGAILSASATAFIEDYCDRCQAELTADLASQGKTLGERFSPGYGDFALEHQKDLFAILDCPRKIGLTLTDELIMVPTKSVTAIMAIDGHCGKQLGCQFCMKENCLYRRI